MTATIPIFANTGAAPTQGTSEAVAAEFRGGLIDPLMRLRLEVLALANALKGSGGPDYTASLLSGAGTANTLRKDASTALEGFDRDMVSAVEAYLFYRAAVAAGFNPGATPSARNVNSIGIRMLDEDDLSKMRIFLLDLLFAQKF